MAAKKLAFDAEAREAIRRGVKQLAHAVLDHRLIIRPENRLRKMTATSIVDEILKQVEVPLVPEEIGKS